MMGLRFFARNICAEVGMMFKRSMFSSVEG
jgi:hypothetical protein